MYGTARTVDYAQNGHSDIYERFCFLSQFEPDKNVVYWGRYFVIANTNKTKKGFFFFTKLLEISFLEILPPIIIERSLNHFIHKTI